jgi:hypothetical protein
MLRYLTTARALLCLTVAAAGFAATGSAAAKPLTVRSGGSTPTGTWKRVLTQADIDRTASFRVEPAGATPPPQGPMSLAIANASFTFTDLTGFSIGQTLRIGGGGAFDILAYVAPDKGAFCTADEPQNAAYTWKLDGKALVLTPVDDRCADRNSILAGRWKHASVTRTLIATQTSLKLTKKGGGTFSDRLSEGGKPAGSDAAVCTTISASVSDCRVVLRLGDGTISVHGKLRDAPSQHYAITGGTGAYAGAKGSIVVRARSAKVRELTLKLA